MNHYRMLLSGGMWDTIDVTYDESEIHDKKIRPFKVAVFTPFQISVIIDRDLKAITVHNGRVD